MKRLAMIAMGLLASGCLCLVLALSSGCQYDGAGHTTRITIGAPFVIEVAEATQMDKEGVSEYTATFADAGKPLKGIMDALFGWITPKPKPVEGPPATVTPTP